MANLKNGGKPFYSMNFSGMSLEHRRLKPLVEVINKYWEVGFSGSATFKYWVRDNNDDWQTNDMGEYSPEEGGLTVV